MDNGILEHFPELKWIVVSVFAIGITYGEARYRLWRMSRDHRDLKKGQEKMDKKIDTKRDVDGCAELHTEQRSGLQAVLDTIQLGNTNIMNEMGTMRKEQREDMKNVHNRLDTHINGKTGGD